MAEAVSMPRLNANDDEVVIAHISVRVGQKVSPGDVLFEVETEKTVLAVECERAGYILSVDASEGDTVRVGKAVLWIGASMEEQKDIPGGAEMATGIDASVAPTLKAKQLIDKYGLNSVAIPAKGDRITVEDVEAYMQVHGTAVPTVPESQETHPLSSLSGRRHPLTAFQKAMVKTVSWHFRHACATYLEIIYDHALWRAYADAFMKEHRLMLDPMLGLMAYQLVRATVEMPFINATIEGDSLVTFDAVNLGFTVEANNQLFLVVARNAEQCDQIEFVRKLTELQKGAFKGTLKPVELSGATIAFTSLAKRGVSRHVPILPPGASLMLSHSAPLPVSGQNTTFVPSVLGATYDHRVLDGSAVAQVLARIGKPPVVSAELRKVEG